jgi:hypothetical protein
LPAIFLPHVQLLTTSACFWARAAAPIVVSSVGTPYSFISHFAQIEEADTVGKLNTEMIWESNGGRGRTISMLQLHGGQLFETRWSKSPIRMLILNKDKSGMLLGV